MIKSAGKPITDFRSFQRTKMVLSLLETNANSTSIKVQVPSKAFNILSKSSQILWIDPQVEKSFRDLNKL